MLSQTDNSVPAFMKIPKNDTEEYYEIQSHTGFASIDKPHIKFFKKGTLEAEFPKMKMFDYMQLKTEHISHLPALNYYGRKITFGELYQKVEAVAKAFLAYGVKEGDYVAISMPTTPEAAYMLFALNRIGSVAIEIDPRTKPEILKEILRESGAKLYITMDDNAILTHELLQTDKDIALQLKDVIFISPTYSLPFVLRTLSGIKDRIDQRNNKKSALPKAAKYSNWDEFLARGSHYVGKIDSEYKANTVTEIIFSSGTTNKPKPIEYTNETFTAMVRQIELGENAYHVGDKNLDIIPLFLGFGSNNGLYAVLCFGVEDILMPKPVLDDLPELIKKYKPNHLLGAPLHMSILLKYLQADESHLKDLSFLKSIVSGSAYLESSKQYALDEQLAKRGAKIKVGPGYGQNEGGPCLSFSTDTFLELKKPGCSGFPLSHTTISIFDPDTDEELEYGKDLEGEIRYIAPCSMKGYAFGRESDTAKYFRLGKDGQVWSCSGDLGRIDADGGIYITGRIERQIHRLGFKYSPTYVEELVTGNVQGIDTCALIGKADPDEEMKTVLYYTIKEAYKQNSETIKEQIVNVCSTLEDYKVPCKYVERESMPYTKNQKLDFKLLEKEA